MKRIWISLAIVLPCLFVAFGYGATKRVGLRAYFSPDTLESRSQVEFALVWGRLTISPPSELVQYLIEKGFWQPRQVAEPRWIEMSHINHRWRGGINPLHKELTWKRGWIEWIEANPTLAKALWPRVLTILRENTDAPSWRAVVVMSVARSAKNVGEFERLLAAEDLGK
jgi:hypothetical protein